MDEQCGFENLAICTAGVGGNKPFSTLMVEEVSEVQLLSNGQVFPRYSYEEVGVGE